MKTLYNIFQKKMPGKKMNFPGKLPQPVQNTYPKTITKQPGMYIICNETTLCMTWQNHHQNTKGINWISIKTISAFSYMSNMTCVSFNNTLVTNQKHMVTRPREVNIHQATWLQCEFLSFLLISDYLFSAHTSLQENMNELY